MWFIVNNALQIVQSKMEHLNGKGNGNGKGENAEAAEAEDTNERSETEQPTHNDIF